MPSSTPSLSVIIVTHNSLPILGDCLRHLQKATASEEPELIVVDNNSTKDPSEVIGTFFPRATVLHNRGNTGFARACNQGAKVANGAKLLFLNPDVLLDPEAVDNLQAAAARPQAGLVAGRLRYPDGRFQATCRNFPKPTNLLFSRGSILTKLIGRSVTGANLVYTLPDYDEVTPVPAVAGTLLLVSRSVFQQAGGFDSRFFMYMEDTDLSLRIDGAGYRNLFVPKGGGVHDWGRGSAAGRVVRVWWHHWSLWQYFMKHQANGFSLVLLPLLLAMHFLLALILMPLKREHV